MRTHYPPKPNTATLEQAKQIIQHNNPTLKIEFIVKEFAQFSPYRPVFHIGSHKVTYQINSNSDGDSICYIEITPNPNTPQ